MNRPKRLRIGPHTWSVRWGRGDVLRHAPAGDAVGVCDYPSLTIAVEPARSEDYMRHTLLHEVLHACVRASDPPLDDEHEELAISAMTGPLLAALRDNPPLVAYIMASE